MTGRRLLAAVVLVPAAAVAAAMLAPPGWLGLHDQAGESPATLAAPPAAAPDPDVGSGSPGVASAGGTVRPPRAARILRDWDQRRAQAYARADLAALRRLYVAGSSAGTADVRLLRDYRRRGLRVTGLRTQLLAVDVLARGAGRLRVEVTDRVHGGVVVGRRSRVPLPRDAATTRVVSLRRSSPGPAWRVAAVRPAPDRATQTSN